MTKPQNTPLPSDAELEILKALWDQPGSTAKRLHEAVNVQTNQKRVVTTTAKFLQIMLGKGLVGRDESTWPHTYTARVTREAVMRGHVHQTLSQLFNKSASQFMLAAIESGSVTGDDIAEIKSMLKAYEEEKGDG